MKTNILDKEIVKSYSEKTFEIDISSEENLGRLFKSLIMIYQDKFSFIREFVQNSYDAVVEVWENEYKDEVDLDTFLINNPIIVSLFEDDKGKYIQIKETKGVGISPDRMDNMFRFLTKSTKRDSLNQIGAKGIGKMAALSYTDEYFLSTIYDGIQYEYKISWYNQQGIPKLSEPVCLPVNQHNGTTITVYLLDDSDLKLLRNSIKKFLSYFNNIYYNNLTIERNTSTKYTIHRSTGSSWGYGKTYENLNDLILYNFNTFAYRTGIDLFESETFLIVDRIPYRISWADINHSIMYVPLGIKVSSADVLLNDNRDSIRYTPSVVEHIRKKIDEFKSELLYLLNNKQFNHTKDILLLWKSQSRLTLGNFEFVITTNPLASWSETCPYIKNIYTKDDDNYVSNKLKTILFEISLIKGTSKLFKVIDIDYLSILDSYRRERRYQIDRNSLSVYVNDVDTPLTKIQGSDIIGNNIVVLKKLDIVKLKNILSDCIYESHIDTVVNIISKYHSEIGKKFSTIFDTNKTKNNILARKNKVKVNTLTSTYGKTVITDSSYMQISEITSDYVVFSDKDSDLARTCSYFFYNFNIPKKVVLVAPSYYSKVKYNISYYCNNNEEFKRFNTAFHIYKNMFKNNYNGLIYLFNSRIYIYNNVKCFSDTIIGNLLNPKLNEDIFELIRNIDYKERHGDIFFDTFKNIIDTQYVISDVVNDITKLCDIFFVEYKELTAIDYKADKKLINNLVKIILNKNCNEQNIYS